MNTTGKVIIVFGAANTQKVVKDFVRKIGYYESVSGDLSRVLSVIDAEKEGVMAVCSRVLSPEEMGLWQALSIHWAYGEGTDIGAWLASHLNALEVPLCVIPSAMANQREVGLWAAQHHKDIIMVL